MVDVLTATDDTDAPTPTNADVDKRAKRAVDEEMLVLPLSDADDRATGMYLVVTQSKNIYTVDASAKSCSCPDCQYRNEVCKHRRRVAFGFQACEIPRIGDSVTGYYENNVYSLPVDLMANAGRQMDADVLEWFQRVATEAYDEWNTGFLGPMFAEDAEGFA